METARDKWFFTNSMLCLLKAVEGKVTTVELRSEKEVQGRVVNVDGCMNITMSNVVYKCLGKEDKKFSQFFVNGQNVRYVHIPDEIDIKKGMNRVLAKYCSHTANLRVKQEIQQKAWDKMKKKESQAIKEHKLREKMKNWDSVKDQGDDK